MNNENNPYAPPTSPPNEPASNGGGLRQVLNVFGRGLTYALCVWTVHVVFYPPRSSNSDAAEEKQRADQMRSYQEQLDRSNAMFAETEKQQKRMGEVIAKQEELVKRLDVVMSAWERQSGVSK